MISRRVRSSNADVSPLVNAYSLGKLALVHILDEFGLHDRRFGYFSSRSNELHATHVSQPSVSGLICDPFLTVIDWP